MFHALEKANLRVAQGNWEMEVRATAEGALQLLNECQVDLVLTDLILPGITGIDLVGRL